MSVHVCSNPACGRNEEAVENTGCLCRGWCDCHKTGWPAGETCDCRPACEYCGWPTEERVDAR